jgi:hypothetical protein
MATDHQVLADALEPREVQSETQESYAKTLLGRSWVFEAWLRCPMRGKSVPASRAHRDRMRHRRTVGPDIPCRVAPLQSPTPLLWASGV